MLNEAIESVKKDISGIELNPEFSRYQQKKKVRKTGYNCFYFGGFLTMLGGVFGGIFFDKKRNDLEWRLKV